LIAAVGEVDPAEGDVLLELGAREVACHELRADRAEAFEIETAEVDLVELDAVEPPPGGPARDVESLLSHVVGDDRLMAKPRESIQQFPRAIAHGT
jgi:hypothetical protein